MPVAPCSIWTVDLAHLLRRFGLEVTFVTTMIGANPDYAEETFYADTMQEDNRRVEQLFKVDDGVETEVLVQSG